jgi:hypothetical protein
MIEIAIISFGIGSVLGGLTFFGGYHIGYKFGHADGYKKACHEQASSRQDMLILTEIFKHMNQPPSFGNYFQPKPEEETKKETAE